LDSWIGNNAFHQLESAWRVPWLMAGRWQPHKPFASGDGTAMLASDEEQLMHKIEWQAPAWLNSCPGLAGPDH
jgi:hypothetical protein